MARLLADENIHPLLIQALGNLAHDVRSVHVLGLQGKKDEVVLKVAMEQGRILITADKDFGFILEFGALAGRGRVILLRYKILNWTRISEELAAALVQTESDFAATESLLVVLSESQIRIRRWSR